MYKRQVSWRPDPEAEAIDAFQSPLSGENPWCFPPEALIPRLLGLLTRQRATITLVAPQWPGKPWWPDLIRMMIDKPIKLPNHHSTLQAIGMNEVSGLPHWNLAIFRISGAPSALVASDSLIKQPIPGLPQDGDSKWRAYKRYCSLVETPTWTVSV